MRRMIAWMVLGLVACGPAMADDSVGLSLEWLRKRQDKSGAWKGHNPVFLTSMATLAFLSAGHTHRYGRYKATVKAAMRYYLRIQDKKTGFLGPKRGQHVLAQAAAALALCEAYGMTKSPLVKIAARPALRWLIQAQDDETGNWSRFRRPGHADMDPTIFAVFALKSAKAAELQVPGRDAAWRRVKKRVMGRRPTDRTPLAINMINRVFCGVSKRDRGLVEGAKRLRADLPKGKDHDINYVYFGTLAAFQVGGETWKAWTHAKQRTLVQTQVKKGNDRGSWRPTAGLQSSLWGPVYTTALSTLCVQIWYRRWR